MTASIQRAHLLIEQGRFAHAENELRGVLGDDPDSPEAHMLLALCLSERNEYVEATREAEAAIHLAPDSAETHRVHGSVLIDRNRYDEAYEALVQSAELDPFQARTFGLLANVSYARKKWQQAADYAEEGLALDPDDPLCANMLTFSLEKLGRVEDALDAANRTLSQHPDDSYAHATQGMAHLHASDYKQAQESFREALRLDPDNELAQQGMINALNSRSFIFRWIFKYYTLMARMSTPLQFGLIIGLVVVQRGLGVVARSYPALQPLVFPVLILLVCFVVLTWIVTPVFNTFLRFNTYGRYLLNRDQIVSSNWIAGVLLAGVLGFVASGVIVSWSYAIVLLGYTILIVMPLSGVFFCDPGWPRWVMAAVTGCLALLGFWILASAFFAPLNPLLLNAFLIGIFGSQFLANMLGQVTVKN